MSRERLAEASARVQELQKFAKPAAAVDPTTAPKACDTDEHRRFAAILIEGMAQADRRAKDPTEYRA